MQLLVCQLQLANDGLDGCLAGTGMADLGAGKL